MAARRSDRGRSKAEREFLSEAEDILERLRNGMADLEDCRASDAEVNPDLINELFRSAHSLKGLAGMFGHDPMTELAHHLEDVLDALRLGRIRLDENLFTLLRDSVMELATLMESLGDSDSEQQGSEAVASLAARIEEATQASGTDSSELEALEVDPTLLRALTEYEEHRLRENMRRGRRILLVEASFEILSFDEGLAELGQAIREAGELISTLPSPGDTPDSQIRFALLVASEMEDHALHSHLDLPHVTVRTVSGGQPAPSATPAPQPAAPPAAATQPAAREEEPSAAAPSDADSAEIESLRSISETVRVDIRKLDELMNLVGELMIQRGAIENLVRQLSGLPNAGRIAGDLRKVHQSLEKKLRELQSGVLDVRMVPLRQVFEKISRVGRRLRRDLDKEVRLDLKGADTELDKLIVEQLVDPLMHVVRNGFDHAIEPEEERVEAGKDPEGCIQIEAFQRGNHVVIEVRDDGRGIDREKLRERALAAGLITADQVLTDREVLDFVFAPGITTREEVTETSGRGVGMDVVKANLTSFGGIVDIESELGKGTTITMTLPITLAIIQALVVGVADQSYAIPLNSILETLVVDPEEIQRSDDREILNLRGEPLPLRRLAREFDLPDETPDRAHQFVVVLGIGESRLGLLVHRLEGQQDAVIKPIQGPIPSIPGIAGATELGNQNAVLVIDVTAFIEEAHRRREAA